VVKELCIAGVFRVY